MSNELKITFVGGADHLGDARSLKLDGPVFVGRSHKAAIRFTEKDGDVSGVHVEIRKEADGVFAVAVKEYVLNERDTVPCGELRRLTKGDVLTLGPSSRAGIRIDALPADGGTEPEAEAPTGETRFTSATGATRFTSATGVTRFATGVTRLTSATGATHAPEAAGAGAGPEYDDRPTEVLDVSTGEGVTADGGGATTGSGIGKTVPLPQDGGSTVMIDPSLIGRIDPDAPQRFRRRLMVFSLFGFAAMLGVVVYSRMNHSAPYLSHPKPIATTVFKGVNGVPEIQIDYPWHDKATKAETPLSVEVMTLTGKNHDCPFHLEFSIKADAAQLKMSLEESAERELALLEKRGYSFNVPSSDDSVSPEERAGYFFLEDQYPGSCQGLLPRGTRFFRREYVVSRSGEGWWGVFIVFRDGDKVYRLLRDIPERQKPRGRFLLLIDPNILLYSPFLTRYWESTGISADFEDAKVDDLLLKAQRLVDRGWPEDWRMAEEYVNALMVMTYGKRDALQKSVDKLRLDLQRHKDDLWRDFEIERDIALGNGDFKRLKSVCERCRASFGNNPRDWRFKRSNDAEEWPWEKSR